MRQSIGATALALAAGVVLSACGASGGTEPSTASGAQSPQTLVRGDAKTYNFSGEYSGLIIDSKNGTGKAAARLSQAKTAIGGALTIAGNPTIAYISWIPAGVTVTGSSVFVTSSGAYCSFSHKSTYNPNTGVLAGSYKALHGCLGESGTYKLKHHCYYKYGAAVDIRPAAGPHPC
ncbi:MAG: hypothetical protein JO078_06035 [Candidatus Eremiobacteraeota bacterium]|nr:hypothetical protein [Candidatus Eremiobacteraeota bacterium]